MAASCAIFLNVRDIKKSIRFYERLGFKTTGRHKGKDGRLYWADLELDGAELGLAAIAANDDPEFLAWVSTPLGAGVVAYFTVPDVDRYWQLAKKARARIESPLEDRSYGRVFTVNDPDEYTITFLAEPAKPRAPRKAATRRAAKTSAPRRARSSRPKAPARKKRARSSR